MGLNIRGLFDHTNAHAELIFLPSSHHVKKSNYEHPGKPHFVIGKMGFTGVYIMFLIFIILDP